MTKKRTQTRNLLGASSRRTYVLAILMATVLMGCSSELDRCAEANQGNNDDLINASVSLPTSISNLPIKNIKEWDGALVKESIKPRNIIII